MITQKRRSRKGAWIEIGLQDANDLATASLPQGSVD